MTYDLSIAIYIGIVIILTITCYAAIIVADLKQGNQMKNSETTSIPDDVEELVDKINQLENELFFVGVGEGRQLSAQIRKLKKTLTKLQETPQ